MIDFTSLDPLIRPRSIAIIGASDDRTRIGGRPIAYMQNQNFQGTIYPVNPKRDVIQGLPAFADIASLPATPDVGLIAVAGDAAIAAVEALGQRGCKGIIMFTAGFAEMDEAGAAKQEELVKIVRRYGMRMLGPNCLGLFNAAIGFYPIFSSSFETGWPLAGRRSGHPGFPESSARRSAPRGSTRRLVHRPGPRRADRNRPGSSPWRGSLS
jgi:acyl-CoA synthetase (NDP forming)